MKFNYYFRIMLTVCQYLTVYFEFGSFFLVILIKNNKLKQAKAFRYSYYSVFMNILFTL